MNNRPNVIILVWDAARARNTSLHGYNRDTTPFLSTITDDEAVWYQQARAPSSWTLPSHASIVTGLYPREHQTHSKSVKFGLDQRHLATRLSSSGYCTGLFTNNTYLRADEFGFSASFDKVPSDSLIDSGGEAVLDPAIHAKVHGHGAYLEFLKESLRSSSPARSLARGVLHKLKRDHPFFRNLVSEEQSEAGWGSDDGAATDVDSFFEWIDTNEGPFFALFNFLETHAPYQPPAGYRDYVSNINFKNLPQTPPWEYYAGRHPQEYLDDLQDLYDGCIRYLDDVTEDLVARLEERGLLDDTLLVIAGDHGEGFGEPGLCRKKCIGHAGGIEEEVIHVPLVIRYPAGRYGGQNVSDVVSLKDIYGTILTECVDGQLEKTAQLQPDTSFPPRVLAHRNGLTEVARSNAREHGLDVTEFDREFVAYYENGDTSSTANKYTFSTDDECEIAETVTWDGTTTALDSSDSVLPGLKCRGREYFENLEPAVEPRKDGIDISVETQNRLEYLGYR